MTVGEEAQGWSGVAKIGNMTEWPAWTPTAGEHQRLGPLPNFVAGGPQNPMGARAMYLYANGKDTLFRIHGTNQPEYIGQAISSGCIRLTNEDVIDLYSRVKLGTPVVVLAPGQGDSPLQPEDRAVCERRCRPELRLPIARADPGSAAKPQSSGDRADAADLDVHDFRRHAEPHRHGAGAEPAGHDHVPAVLDDVPVGEPRPVTGRHESSAIAAEFGSGRHGCGRRASGRRAAAP